MQHYAFRKRLQNDRWVKYYFCSSDLTLPKNVLQLALPWHTAPLIMIASLEKEAVHLQVRDEHCQMLLLGIHLKTAKTPPYGDCRSSNYVQTPINAILQFTGVIGQHCLQ